MRVSGVPNTQSLLRTIMEVSTKHPPPPPPAPLVSPVWPLRMSFIVHVDLCQGVGGTGTDCALEALSI